MENQELHEQFDGKVSEFEKYQGFIAKTKELADKYSAEVVEKVIGDNDARSMETAGELMLIVGDVESFMAALEGKRTETLEGAEAQRMALQELDLNLMIEAIDQETYDAQSAEMKIAVESADEIVAAIDLELEAFEGVTVRWTRAGTEAGVLTVDKAAADDGVEGDDDIVVGDDDFMMGEEE
jgi:hypothetical protein